jgi:hypothetical protein
MPLNRRLTLAPRGWGTQKADGGVCLELTAWRCFVRLSVGESGVRLLAVCALGYDERAFGK